MMTAIVGPLIFLIGLPFTIIAEPYGYVGDLNLTAALGMVVMTAVAAMLITGAKWRITITVDNTIRLTAILVAGIGTLAAASAYGIARLGPPEIFYLLQGKLPPEAVIGGRFRSALPLKELIGCLAIALPVFFFIVRGNRFVIVAGRILSGLATLTIAAAFSLRYVLVWTAIYIFIVWFPTLGSIFVRRNRTLLLVSTVGGAVVTVIFIIAGNIRANIGESASVRFAQALGLQSNWVYLPLPALWALIYVTSGFARGMANASGGTMHWFTGLAEPQLLPGFLQPSLAGQNLFTVQQFREMAFAIDGWHAFILYHGIVLAVVAFLCLGLACRRTFQRISRAGDTVQPLDFVLWVWISVRVILLPIGNYVADLSAILEGVLLYAFLQFTHATIGVSRDVSPSPPSSSVEARPERTAQA